MQARIRENLRNPEARIPMLETLGGWQQLAWGEAEVNCSLPGRLDVQRSWLPLQRESEHCDTVAVMARGCLAIHSGIELVSACIGSQVFSAPSIGFSVAVRIDLMICSSAELFEVLN